MATDARPTTRIMKKVGGRWERMVNERGLGRRTQYLDVIYHSGMRKPPPPHTFLHVDKEKKKKGLRLLLG